MKIKLSDIADGNLSQEQATQMQDYFKKGGTWAELLKLTPIEVEEVYAKGYNHYQEGEFEKALAAFSALIQLDPYVAKHWIAVGAALHAQKEFRQAIGMYDIAEKLDEKDMRILYYRAQSLLALDEKAEAMQVLEKIVLAQGEFSEKALEILAYLREGK